MKNKVTALIVTYRRPKFLKRAIQSVIDQSYSNIQISVFDDASGDETKSIVEALSKKDERISYYCHKENIGQFANFRYAFESVETPYFSILSDDDCISEDLYKNAVDVLDNNPNVMFVILNMKKIITIIFLSLSLILLMDSCKVKKRYKYKGPAKNCDCPNG